jgi:predicted O-methyltransferase YrrM
METRREFFHCSTGEFCKIATNKKIEIDLLFIDASHDYKSVKNDFLNYFSLIKKNGLILFHDSHPKNLEYTDSKLCGDGYKAIDELTRAANDYEMMTIPVHPGLTICRKRDNHLTFEK